MPEWVEILFTLIERFALPTILLVMLMVSLGLAAVGLWKAVWPFATAQVERWQVRKDAEEAHRVERAAKQTAVMQRQAAVLTQLGKAMEQVGREVQATRREQQAQGDQINTAFEETNKSIQKTSDMLTRQLIYAEQFNRDILEMRRDKK